MKPERIAVREVIEEATRDTKRDLMNDESRSEFTLGIGADLRRALVQRKPEEAQYLLPPEACDDLEDHQLEVAYLLEAESRCSTPSARLHEA
jgi:hypothetical protein